MALAPEDIATRYPLPAYNFRVEVDGITVSASELSGITIEREHKAYRHGLSHFEGEILFTWRNNRYRPITMQKGVVHGMRELHDWMNDGNQAAKAMQVHLCDQDGAPVVTWSIAKAIPVKIEAPSFDPNDNAVAIEKLELMAAGISITHQ